MLQCGVQLCHPHFFFQAEDGIRDSSVTGVQTCALLFFFQAEDGIRDSSVTGVQTCALPILREVKGILALALSGFGFVALYAFDPTLHLLDQSSPVGPVGVWLGWVFFWAFGYGGYLFLLLLAGYGASAFIRSRMVTGWPAAAGLG